MDSRLHLGLAAPDIGLKEGMSREVGVSAR